MYYDYYMISRKTIKQGERTPLLSILYITYLIIARLKVITSP
jgi:hypothetical protein